VTPAEIKLAVGAPCLTRAFSSCRRDRNRHRGFDHPSGPAPPTTNRPRGL